MVFLLKAEFRLIDGNKTEEYFCFLFKEHFSYNLSHLSVNLASFKGVSSFPLNVLKKRLGTTCQSLQRWDSCTVRRQRMEKEDLQSFSQMEDSLICAETQNFIPPFIFGHWLKIENQRKEFGLMENHLWSLNWMKWKILDFFIAFLLYSLKLTLQSIM